MTISGDNAREVFLTWICHHIFKYNAQQRTSAIPKTTTPDITEWVLHGEVVLEWSLSMVVVLCGWKSECHTRLVDFCNSSAAVYGYALECPCPLDSTGITLSHALPMTGGVVWQCVAAAEMCENHILAWKCSNAHRCDARTKHTPPNLTPPFYCCLLQTCSLSPWLRLSTPSTARVSETPFFKWGSLAQEGRRRRARTKGMDTGKRAPRSQVG
jgi:hypothetical protein